MEYTGPNATAEDFKQALKAVRDDKTVKHATWELWQRMLRCHYAMPGHKITAETGWRGRRPRTHITTERDGYYTVARHVGRHHSPLRRWGGDWSPETDRGECGFSRRRQRERVLRDTCSWRLIIAGRRQAPSWRGRRKNRGERCLLSGQSRRAGITSGKPRGWVAGIPTGDRLEHAFLHELGAKGKKIGVVDGEDRNRGAR
jgi:hypothetical protein